MGMFGNMSSKARGMSQISSRLHSIVTINPGDKVARFFEGHGPQTKGLDESGAWSLPVHHHFYWGGISLVPAKGTSEQDCRVLSMSQFKFKFASRYHVQLHGGLILDDAALLAGYEEREPAFLVLKRGRPVEVVALEAWLAHLEPPVAWAFSPENQTGEINHPELGVVPVFYQEKPTPVEPAFRLEAPVEVQLVLHGSYVEINPSHLQPA